MNNSFLTKKEISEIGFKFVGENVFISRFTNFYGEKDISIGDNSRIDDFCILSGNIEIKSYVHIGANCMLYGSKGIFIDDYSGISAGSIVYSAVDDFSGNFMVGPLISKELTNVVGGPVVLKKYVQIGANNIILPNTIINEGAVTGALSLVNKNLEKWTINIGIPSKILKNRSKNILNLVKKGNV